VSRSSSLPDHNSQFTNHLAISYHSTNYYALDINGGKLLVDCGWPATWPRFAAELKRKGVSAAEIRYLLATHFHPDHAGLIEEFKKLGAQLLLLETQLGALDPADPHIRSPFVHTSPGNNLLITFAGSRAFLASLGLAGEIIPTPGHSDDSVSLVLDGGSAFTGDLPPRFLVPNDAELLRTSWAELDRHGVRNIYPAHGG
jgi:glyoxylase-like metal-dependent hydrolase (beta-lactamase superfamily II)